MGNSSAKRCEGNNHVMQPVFNCMMETCGSRKEICRNEKCGFNSARHKEIWMCKLCKITELNFKKVFSQEEINQGPT